MLSNNSFNTDRLFRWRSKANWLSWTLCFKDLTPMNVFAEVDIRSRKGTAYLFDTLRQFAADTAEWIFDEEKSASYSDDLPDSVGCVLLLNGNEWMPGIAICEEWSGHCRIANIVPKRTGTMPTDEYNQIAQKFYAQVREWSNKRNRGLRLAISKTDLELEDIITAEIPRKCFKVFLNNYPLSHHPNDISRLDRFICSVSRYSRRSINWEYLGEYLCEKKHWPEDGVDWCLNRIRTGLEIIHEYKRFH